MSKKTPFDDEQLRKDVAAHLAQKKKQQPSSDTSGTPSTNGLLSENPFGQTTEQFLGSDNMERIRNEVEFGVDDSPAKKGLLPEMKLELGDQGVKSDTPGLFNRGGLMNDIDANLNNKRTTTQSKELYERLNDAGDIWDRIERNRGGDGSSVKAKPKDATFYDDVIDRYHTGLYALGSGIDMLGTMAGNLPNAAVDLLLKTQPGLKELFGDRGYDAEDFANFYQKNLGIEKKYNPFSSDNAIVEAYSNRAKENSAMAYRNYSGGIGQAIGNGDYEGAGSLAAIGIVQSLPIMLGLMATRGAGASELGSLGFLGLGTTGTTYKDLKAENPNMDKNVLYANALLTGLGEAGSELMGTNEIYNQGARLFSRGATEEAERVVRGGVRGYLDAAFKKSFIGSATFSEGFTEAANQVWKNAVDKWSGVKPDVDYTDGVLDSFIIGAGAGATVAGAFKGLNNVTSKINSLANKSKVRGLISENESIAPYLTDSNLSPEASSKLMDQVAANNEAINNTMESDANSAREILNDVEAKTVSDINSKIDQKESIISDPSMPQAIKDSTKRSIDEMEKQVDEVLNVAKNREELSKQLQDELKLADTPEKIAKILSKVNEIFSSSPSDPKQAPIIDKAEEKLKIIKSEKPKEGETISAAKKDLLDELDAELDALKKSVPLKPDVSSADDINGSSTIKPNISDIDSIDKINTTVDELSDENYLFTHVTTEDDAKNISNSEFKVNPGQGISSTLTQLGSNGVKEQLKRLINGEIVHRNTDNNSLSLISVPKSILDNVDGNSISDKFENWLVLNNKIDEDGNYSIPNEFNSGYLNSKNINKPAKEVTPTPDAPAENKPESVAVAPNEKVKPVEEVKEPTAKEKASVEVPVEKITELTPSFNTNAFEVGDTVVSKYSKEQYEVVQPDSKQGMGKLKNLNTGVVEDWNANNNPHFVKIAKTIVEPIIATVEHKPTIKETVSPKIVETNNFASFGSPYGFKESKIVGENNDRFSKTTPFRDTDFSTSLENLSNGNKKLTIHFKHLEINSNRGGAHAGLSFVLDKDTSVTNSLVENLLPKVKKFREDNFNKEGDSYRIKTNEPSKIIFDNNLKDEKKPTVPEKENVAEVPVQPATETTSAKNDYIAKEKTNPNKYYAQNASGSFVEVKDASPVNVGLEGDFFVNPALVGDGFVVTEGTTGLRMGEGATEVEAVKNTADKIKKFTDEKGEEAFYQMLQNKSKDLKNNPRYLNNNTTGLKVGDKVTFLGRTNEVPRVMTVDSIDNDGINFRDVESGELSLASTFDAVKKHISEGRMANYVEPTPEPPAKPTVKEKIQSIQNEELIAAKKAFLDTFKNLNSGINPETLDKGLKLMAVYTKLGVYKFADIVNDIKADFGDKLGTYFESLKAAYGAYKSLDSTPDEVIDQMDSFGEYRKLKLENFLNPNTNNDERTSEPLPVDQNASAVPTGEQPQDVNGVAPNTPTEGLRGAEDATGRETGNEVVGENNAVSSGDSGRSGGTSTDATGNVDRGTGIDGSTGSSVPKNTGKRKVKINDQNHVIEENDVIAPAGEVGKFNANVDAIFMLNKLDAENRNPTPAEKKALAQYVGWGGLARYLSYSGTSREDDAVVTAFMKGGEAMVYKNNAFTKSKVDFTANGPVDLSKYNSSADLVNAIRTELAREGYSITPDAIRPPMLKNMISPTEYQAAQTSTISAHFTDKRVVDKMWEIVNRLGFKGGKVLESSFGTGNILGLMPSNLRNNTSVTAYELDDITGRIATKLYPQANVVVDGFENAKVPLNSQDLVITNVPFGQTAPYDKFYPELSKFSLHNYFIGKNLKMLKPGGIGVMITSASTMDAGSSAKFREWVTSPSGGNSVLIGAIRLPNNAFAENAGTQVTADVLVFQKRTANENNDLAQDFRYAKYLTEGSDRNGDPVKIDVNEYFINNPQQMLGEMMTAADAGSGALYGNGNSSTLVAPADFNITTALNDAIDNFPANIMDNESNATATPVVEEEAITAMDKKEGSLFAKDGKVYRVSDGIGTPVQLEGKQAVMAKDYVGVKSDMLGLIELEQTENANEAEIENKRIELNKKYDEFVKKHGNINGRNAAFLEDIDVDFPIATALENIKRSLEKVGTSGKERIVQEITKGEILKKRINFPRVEPTVAKDIKDAIDISLNYKNGINVNYIAKLLGEDADVIEQRLLEEDLSYENPDTGLLEAPDEYLSGYVRDKLKKAEIALENDPKYAKNVEELKKIIPEDIPSSLIQYTLGAGWIPTSVYSEFAQSILDTPVTVNYMESAGKFSAKAQSRYGAKIKTTYGAGGKDAMDILNATLNNSQIVVMDTYKDENGNKKTVKNIEATAAAQAMQEQMQEEFQAWIRENEAVALDTERIYNDTFNGQVLRDYRTPAFDHYPGASTTIKLRQHQKRAVSRGLSESTLNAHQVGSGKTFTIITTAMEMRRLGLAKKPMIVVQNATRGQFVSSFRLLYPGAKILVPTDKELSADGRKRFFAKIATGYWDAVLIPQSQLSMIPDDPERQQAYIQEQIDEMKTALADMDKYSNPFEYRQLEKEIKALGEEYEDLNNPEGVTVKKRGGKSEAKTIADKSLSIEKGIRQSLDRKTDNIFNFEQLGVDALLIDEAHAYKRLGFQTSMKNIKGIDTSKSKRSQSVLLKTRWVQEKTGGKNVLFYTGTPISNTMAEAWTMLKYVRPDILQRLGIQYFDQFAKTFGQVIPSLEQTGGGTFKVQNRFAKFQNLPEFITAFRTATDVVLSEDVIEFQQEDTLPKLSDGKIKQQVVQQSPELKAQIKIFRDTLEWFSKLSGKQKKENSHIPLVIFNKAKQASIDLRLLDPNNVDSPQSKVNQAIKNVLEVYHNTDSENAMVQMIFSDMYQSPEPKYQFLDDDELIPNPAFGKDRFNLFNDIKAKLIAGGVKENEIAIMTEPKYDKAERKEQLFANANAGKIRILMGSTERMGVGVNAQQKMRGLHHLDAPARPMDFEQRNGRIIRQGNENKIVDVYAYGVEKTLDSSAFQRLSTKQKFINQIMKGENVDRVTEDPADEAQMTFDEMMAQLSDSPYAMQKLLIDNKIRTEKTKRENFQGKQITINSMLKNTRNALRNAESSLIDDEKYAAIVQDKFKDGNVTNVIASGVTYTEEFGKAIQSYMDMLMEKWNESPTMFAKGLVKINGVNVELEIKAEQQFSSKTKLVVETPFMTYTAPEVGIMENGYGKGIHVNTGSGLMTSLRSQLNKVLEEPAKQKEHIKNLTSDIEELNRTVNTSFDDSKLKELEAESAKLQEQMINEGNNKKDDDDTDPDGGGTGIDYILDQSNVAPVINALDKLKINTNGKMLSSVVPIAPTLWNGAIETMKAVIKATNSIQKGVRVAAKYIINQGGSKAQAEDFKQTINNMYGPGTPIALKLETMANKIKDGKIQLTEKVNELSNETNEKAIKAKLVDVMAEARKTQLIKAGIASADNAAVAIGAVSAINDLETAKEAIDKVLDFLENVGYNSAIKYAKAAHDRLSQIERRNKMALSPTSKRLAQLDPRTLTPSELNDYLELAPVLVSQLDGRDAGLVPDNDIAIFLDEVTKRQDEEIKARLMARYAKLGLDSDMTVEEMKELINESQEETEAKEQSTAPDVFATRENKKREILSAVLSLNREELYDKRNITAEKKILTDGLLNIDEKMLSTGDMVRLNQVIANIVANDRYTGAGYFSKVSQGISQIKKYKELVNKVGGFRPITQDSFLKDRLKGSRLNALSLTDKYLHLNTFEEVGKATDEMLSYPIGNGYANQKTELKAVMDGLDKVIKDAGLAKNAETAYRIGIYGELNSYIVGDKRTREEQFADNKGLLLQTIEQLANSKNKYEKGIYKMLEGIYNDVSSATDISGLRDFLTTEERKVYDYIQQNGDMNFKRLYDNNEMYGSAPMKEKANYVHRRYVPVADGEVKVDLVGDEPIAASANGVLGQSGTKQDVVVKKKLPKGKVVDYNIYKSFRLGLNESLNDIYTLGDRIKADFILKSPEFEETLKIGNDSGRRNLNIIKDSIKQMVNLQRGVSKIDMDMYGGAAAIMKFFRQTFYTSAVGTATAAVPQYISSAMFALAKLNHPSAYMQSMYLFAKDSDLSKRLIQIAGGGTQNRDLQGDNQLDDVANNMSDNLLGRYVSPKISETIDWMNDKLFASLKYGDRLTSLHSWMAGYIDNLIDQGIIKNASEFNIDMLNEHLANPNSTAAVSGETMVTLSNNESDASRKANMFVNKTITQEWVNDILFPVKKFAVAMNNKLWLGIRNVSEWDGGQGDGARLIVGALASMAVYAAIRDFIINKGFDAIGSAITGALGIGDEDDQDKEEQARLKMTDEEYAKYKSDRLMYKFGSETVSDAVLGGQNVVVEKGVKNLVNLLWNAFGDEVQKERKEQKKYVPKNAFYVSNGIASMAGVYGDVAGIFIDVGSDTKSPLNVLLDINKEVDADSDAKARRALFSVGLPLTTNFLLPSADIERINNRIKRRVERVDEQLIDFTLKDKKNKDYKKYHPEKDDQSGFEY